MKIFIAQIHTKEVSIGHKREFFQILGAYADYQAARAVCMRELDTFMADRGISPRMSTVHQYEDSFECICDFDGQACICDFFATELKGSAQPTYDESEVIVGMELEEW